MCRVSELVVCRVSEPVACRVSELVVCRVSELVVCRVSELVVCRVSELLVCRVSRTKLRLESLMFPTIRSYVSYVCTHAIHTSQPVGRAYAHSRASCM